MATYEVSCEHSQEESFREEAERSEILGLGSRRLAHRQRGGSWRLVVTDSPGVADEGHLRFPSVPSAIFILLFSFHPKGSFTTAGAQGQRGTQVCPHLDTLLRSRSLKVLRYRHKVKTNP